MGSNSRGGEVTFENPVSDAFDEIENSGYSPTGGSAEKLGGCPPVTIAGSDQSSGASFDDEADRAQSPGVLASLLPGPLSALLPGPLVAFVPDPRAVFQTEVSFKDEEHKDTFGEDPLLLHNTAQGVDHAALMGIVHLIAGAPMSGGAAGSEDKDEEEESDEEWSVDDQLFKFASVKALSGNSCYIFPPDNPLRVASANVVNHRFFEAFISAVIGVLLVTLMMDSPNKNPDAATLKYFQVSDLVVAVIFTIEAVFRIIASGFIFGRKAYLRSRWNQLDFLIVVTTWLGYVLKDNELFVGTLRVLRLLRPLHSLRFFAGLKVILASIKHANTNLKTTVVLLSLFCLVFSSIGLKIFGGALSRECVDFTNATMMTNTTVSNASVEVCPSVMPCGVPKKCVEVPNTFGDTGERASAVGFFGFDHMGQAVMTIFIVATLDEWPLLARAVQDTGITTAYMIWPLMAILVVLLGLFGTNLFIAVLEHSYMKVRHREWLVDRAVEKLAHHQDGEESNATMQKTGQAAVRDSLIYHGLASTAIGDHGVTHVHSLLDCDHAQAAGALAEAFDTTGDGKADAFDTTGDGKADAFDTSGDGNADAKVLNVRKLVDSNGDGAADFVPVGYDLNGDGKVDAYDTVGDGKLDSVVVGAVDATGDGIADDLLVKESSKSELHHLTLLKDRGNSFPFIPGVSLPLYELVTSPRFEHFITLVILVNALAMSSYQYPISSAHERMIDLVDYCCVLIFTLEAVAKILGLGVSMYFAVPFNTVDFCVAVLSVVSIFIPTAKGGTSLRIVRLLFRIIRFLKMFKLLASSEEIVHLVSALTASTTLLMHLSGLIAFTLTMMAIICMHTLGQCHISEFGDKPISIEVERPNFYTFHDSFLANFQVMTGEDWGPLMFTYMDLCSESHVGIGGIGVLFVGMFVIYNYLLLNLFIAIVLENFSLSEYEKMAKQEDEYRKKHPENLEAEVETLKWLASRAGTDVEAKKAVNRALVGVRKIMQQTSLRESGATGCFGGGEDLMVALEEAKDAVDAAQLEKLNIKAKARHLHKQITMLDSQIQRKDNAVWAKLHRKRLLETTASLNHEDLAADNKIIACKAEVEIQEELMHNKRKQNSRACFVFAHDNSVREAARSIAESAYFEPFMLFVIIASAIALALETPQASAEVYEKLDVFGHVCFVIFVIELMIKVITAGFIFEPDAYLWNGWNILDFMVIFISVIEYTQKFANVGNELADLEWLRVLRVGRLLRALKLVKKVEGMRIIVNVIIGCMPMVLATTAIVMVIYVAFAIFGLYIFAGKFFSCSPDDTMISNCVNASTFENATDAYVNSVCGLPDPAVLNKIHCDAAYPAGAWVNPPYSFDNLGQSLITLFYCATTEGWVDIMHSGMDAPDEIGSAPL
jgi:hypothetical protein